MTRTTLEALAALEAEQLFELTLPLTVELTLTEHPSPKVLANLARLQRLGILNGDAILSTLGQAPIDPINLMQTLMHMYADGWAFSTLDLTMLRVLARTPKNAVAAAMQVDLLSNTITALALNKAGQLTVYKVLEVEARDEMFNQIQALCDEAIAAARRETHTPR